MTDEKFEKIKKNYNKVNMEALLKIIELPESLVKEAIEQIKNTKKKPIEGSKLYEEPPTEHILPKYLVPFSKVSLALKEKKNEEEKIEPDEMIKENKEE